VDTNLDFEKLNSIYHQGVSPKHSSLTPNYILLHIVDSRSDSYFTADYLAEIVTKPVHSEIIRLKHYDFLRARDRSAASIEFFKEMALPNFPTIREAINSGERTVSELLKLLDQAQRFRSWLHAANPDNELLARYTRAATEATWADKLPTKTTRWVVATGLGVAVDVIAPTGLGTLGGLGFSAVDGLVLDKVIKGWRPNHFIEGPYKEFVERRAA
jgi:hypothetical protein